jgi:hypothetical protein
MTTSAITVSTQPARKLGRLATFWRALIAIDDAFHFDPIENLEKRLRSVEDQLAAQSQTHTDAAARSNRAA